MSSVFAITVQPNELNGNHTEYKVWIGNCFVWNVLVTYYVTNHCSMSWTRNKPMLLKIRKHSVQIHDRLWVNMLNFNSLSLQSAVSIDYADMWVLQGAIYLKTELETSVKYCKYVFCYWKQRVNTGNCNYWTECV